MLLKYPSAVPAVLELRPSAMTSSDAARTREQVALEILIDLDHEQRAAAVDPSADVLGATEIAWRSKTRDPSRCDSKALDAALWS